MRSVLERRESDRIPVHEQSDAATPATTSIRAETHNGYCAAHAILMLMSRARVACLAARRACSFRDVGRMDQSLAVAAPAISSNRCQPGTEL